MTAGGAIEVAVAATALLSIPAIVLWLLVDGLRNGVVRARGGLYSRAHDPFWFWLCIALYAALLVWFAYLAVRVAFV
jgi:hypothetical protein